MAYFLLLNKELRVVTAGSDCRIWVDGRLNPYNIANKAKERLESFRTIKPFMIEETCYVIPEEGSKYDPNTFKYSPAKHYLLNVQGLVSNLIDSKATN